MNDLSPPWDMFGEMLVARVRIPPLRSPLLPKGVHRLPGTPAMLIAEHFSSSPTGEFLSFALAVPARLGIRPGIAFPVAAVNSESIRLATRSNWGFPAELGDLRWSSYGHEREFRWEERGIVMRGLPATVPLPIIFRFRALQKRDDVLAVSPILLKGLMRRAVVDVEIDPEDPLAWASGTHRGFYISSSRLRVSPARHPLGLLSTLRLPDPRLRPGEAQ